MTDKEIALKNFIEILFFIEQENNKYLSKVFKTKYLSFYRKEILAESDEFKTLLMWNYQFRKDFYYFYNVILNNGITYCYSFIKKNKILDIEVNKKLEYLELAITNFNELYPVVKITTLSNSHFTEQEIYNLLKESFSIWNDFKVLGIVINGKINSSNLDYKHSIFSRNNFKYLVEGIIINYPDNSLNSLIFSKIENYRCYFIDKFEK